MRGVTEERIGAPPKNTSSLQWGIGFEKKGRKGDPRIESLSRFKGVDANKKGRELGSRGVTNPNNGMRIPHACS